MSAFRINILPWAVLATAVVTVLSSIAFGYVGHTTFKGDDHAMVSGETLCGISLASWIFSLAGVVKLGLDRRPLTWPALAASILITAFTCVVSAGVLWNIFAPLLIPNDEHPFRFETGMVIAAVLFSPVFLVSLFLLLRQLFRCMGAIRGKAAPQRGT